MPVMNTALTSWIPPVAAAVVPTVGTVGAAWGLGRIWEAIQRNWLGEDVPERSFTKRVWEGIKLFPYTLPKRTLTWTAKKAWEHKGSLAIGAGIGTAGPLTGFPAPAGALAVGAIAAGARIPLNAGDGGSSAGNGAPHGPSH